MSEGIDKQIKFHSKEIYLLRVTSINMREPWVR